MSKSSWKMGGGKMDMQFDARGGRSVGSQIRLSGRVFGMELSVQEAVTERDPPRRKSWETIGRPRLLVIDQYRLGFEVIPSGSVSNVRVFIDYELPRQGLEWFCGLLFGHAYARWCTRQMVRDAIAHFAQGSASDVSQTLQCHRRGWGGGAKVKEKSLST